MKGYSSANGDNRGILERFLPSTYRTTKDGSNAHNAFLGAIKGSIETTRDDMEEMSLQVYFTRATGKFLDLYGKYVGLSRNDGEEDQPYRDRIVKYIKTKRGTIEAIIDGIKNELGDPELPVSIYETWRNIFIMNQSTLNGLDYIMGEKYRYAVIEITVGKYVEPDVLTDIVDRYKAYGVKVIYRYALGMSDEVWNDPVDFSQEFIDSDSSYTLTNYLDPYYKKAQVTMDDSPITKKELSLFKMNASKLNGSDVISGNPENAYIFDYTKSPSYHILGYVPDEDVIDNHVDMYDYIYNNNTTVLGTRNYWSLSQKLDGQLIYPDGRVDNSNSGLTAYNPNYFKTTPGQIVWTTFYETVPDNNPNLAGRIVYYDAKKVFISSTSDIPITKGSYKNIVPKGAYYFRISLFKYTDLKMKVEIGENATTWNPSSEDVHAGLFTPDGNYAFGTEPYLVTSRLDDSSYTFSPDTGNSTVLGVNVSRYFINNGYDDLISKYDGSNINSVNIYTKGSEIGLPRTDVKVTGTDGKVAKGQFNVLGGRNLLLNSNFVNGFSNWSNENNTWSVEGSNYKGNPVIKSPVAVGSGNRILQDLKNTPYTSGEKVTVSFYAKSTKTGDSMIVTLYNGVYYTINLTTDWVYYTQTMVIPNNFTVPRLYFWNNKVGDNIWLNSIKMERGETATPWTPAVEEISGYGIDYIYDNSTSTGSYRYVLNTPSPIKTITVDDYYNYGYSNRLVTIKTPNIELPVGIFKGQSTGNIIIPDYSYPDKNFLIASTNRFKLNIDSSSKGVMIYNYTSKKWENYDFNKYYEIGNYIQDAKSIQGAYMLVKFTDSKFELRYFDLEFDTVTIPYTSNSVGYSNKLGQFVLDQSKLG